MKMDKTLKQEQDAFLRDTLYKLLGQDSPTGFTDRAVEAAAGIAKELGFEALDEHLNGTTALAISTTDDVIAPAKILGDFAKTHENFTIKAGYLEGKVIDADDWVESRSLPAFVKALEKCESDVVLTHYRTVNITTGEEKAWRCYPEAFGKAMTLGDVMGRWGDFDRALTFHGIAYRTDFYHRMGLKLSEHIFYEDHEFATFPCCHAETVTPLDIFLYVYRIGDVNQSVSDANQLKRISHVEAVLKRLLTEGEKLPPGAGRDYAAAKAQALLMSYLTTALLVCPDKARGRALAEKAVEALRTRFPENYRQIQGKYKIFRTMSRLHITRRQFEAVLDSRLYGKLTHRRAWK